MNNLYGYPDKPEFAIGDWLADEAGNTGRCIEVMTLSGCYGGEYTYSGVIASPLFMYRLRKTDGQEFVAGHICKVHKVEEPMAETVNTATQPEYGVCDCGTALQPATSLQRGWYSNHVWVACPKCDPRPEPAPEVTAQPTQPDPWNTPEPNTTPALADVVAAAMEETADVKNEADAVLTAAQDDAVAMYTALAGCFNLLREDEITMRELRERAQTYHSKWLGTVHHARQLKQDLAYSELLRAGVQKAYEASEQAVVNATVEIDHLRAKLDATPVAPYAATDNLDPAPHHVGDATTEAELIAAQNENAHLRQRIDELVSKLNTNVQPTPGTRRLSTTTTSAASPDDFDKVANADPLSDILAAMRKCGYAAYVDGQRISPEAWIMQQWANIGAPLTGGASKPAAS